MEYAIWFIPPTIFEKYEKRKKKSKIWFWKRTCPIVPHNTICCSTDAEFKPKVPKYEISIIVNWTKPSLQILMYYFKIVNGRKHLLVLKAEFCKSFALKAAKQYINHLVSRIPSPLSSSSLFWENWTRGASLIWKYGRQGRPTMSHNLLAKKSPKFPFSTIIYFSCQQREKGLIVFLCHLENWALVTIIKTIVFFLLSMSASWHNIASCPTRLNHQRKIAQQCASHNEK